MNRTIFIDVMIVQRTVRLLWTIIPGLLLLVSSVVLHRMDVWHQHFCDPGPHYIWYSIWKCGLFLGFAGLLYQVGAGLLRCLDARCFEGFRGIDRWVYSSSAGAAFLSILTFLIGLAGGYYYWVLLLLTSVLILMTIREWDELLRKGTFISPPKSCGENSLIFDLMIALIGAAVFGMGVWFMVSHGLLPFSIDNDVLGGYIPYFASVMDEHHGLWPTHMFIHFFLSKGVGLHFFLMILSDPLSSQLVNLYLFFLAGGMLYVWMSRIVEGKCGRVLALSAVMLWFLSDFASCPSNKLHPVYGAFIILLIGVVSDILCQLGSVSNLYKGLALLLITAVVIIVPEIGGFLSVFFFILAVFSMIRKSYRHAILMAIGGIVVGVLMVSMLVLNFALSGMFSFAIPPLDKYINADRLSRWTSAEVVGLTRWFNKGDGEVSPRSVRSVAHHANTFINTFFETRLVGQPGPHERGRRWHWFVYFCLIVFFVDLIIGSKRDPLQKRISLAWTVFSVLLATYLVCVMFQHAALARGLIFLSFPRVILYLWPMVILLSWSTHGSIVLQTIVVATFIAGIMSKSIEGERRRMCGYMHEGRIGMLAGLKSIVDEFAYGDPIRECAPASALIPRGEHAVGLSFFPGAYAYPAAPFERPLQCRYAKDAGKVLFGAPDEALQVLRKSNVTYAYIDVGGQLLPLFTVLTPLFSPESLARNYTLVWRGSGVARNHCLLRIRRKGDPLLDKAFIREYVEICTRPVETIHAGRTYLMFSDELNKGYRAIDLLKR